MPGPVCQWTINEYAKQNYKNQIGIKFDPLGKTTRDECGCDDGKFHLKHSKEHKRYGRREERIGMKSYISEESEVKRIAYQTVVASAKA